MDRRMCRIYSFDDIGGHHIFDPRDVPFFETDFTIGRGQAAFVFSCSQVMAFVVGPFAGSLAEKLGPRMVVGGGLSVLAAGLLGSALAQSYGELVFSYGMAVGVGSGVPLLGLIQRWSNWTGTGPHQEWILPSGRYCFIGLRR
jgi:MFS family permease